MKDKLIERIQLLDEAIGRANQGVQDAMAQLNQMQGARMELINVISTIDEAAKAEVKKRKPRKAVAITELTLDKLHDEVEKDNCYPESNVLEDNAANDELICEAI